MSTDAAAARRQESESLKLLTEQVYSLTGYDFRDFTLDTIRPRLLELTRAEGLSCVDALRERVLAEPALLSRAVETLSHRASTLFRGPEFFAALRQSVIPILRTYPTVRIWHAGCGTGEETYSLAILLQEEGLLPRCRIYATDLSPSGIRAAKTAAFPLETLRGASGAYSRAGGRGRLSDHYRVEGPLALFSPILRERVVFSEHSLATDASFNEFQLIVVRDVIFHFNKNLQDRVFRLIDDSLSPLGVLGLGKQHTLASHPLSLKLEPMAGSDTLFRKVR